MPDHRVTTPATTSSPTHRPRAVVHCEANFGAIDGKTANGLVRNSERYEIPTEEQIAKLKEKKADFEEIDAGMDVAKKEEMIQRSGGGRTFPQIFVGDRYLGDCDGIHALDVAGKLDELLGIGVAVSVRVSTLTFISLSLSLILTPNFCSSSMTSRPRSLNFTSLLTIRCVPTRMSTLPSATPARMSLISLVDRKRLMYSTTTGN